MTFLEQIIHIDLDTKVTVHTSFGAFTGTVGEVNTPEATLVICNQQGDTLIDTREVRAITLHKTSF